MKPFVSTLRVEAYKITIVIVPSRVNIDSTTDSTSECLHIFSKILELEMTINSPVSLKLH